MNKYKYSMIVNYKFPTVYVNKNNGKILSEECNTCKFLGNGKYSAMTNKAKSREYGDYNFTCETGVCHSKFLLGLRKGIIEIVKNDKSLIMSNKLIFN